MTTEYLVRVSDPSGNPLAVFSNFIEDGGPALDYVLSVGKIGILVLTLPATVDVNLFPLDARIGVWRSINGAPAQLDGGSVFLVRRWDYGTDYTTITAVHANELFSRRIIAYGTWQAESQHPATPAANLLRAFINENMLGGMTVNRYGTGSAAPANISAYVSLDIAYGNGASIAKAAAWRNLMDTLQEVADASTQNGVYVGAEIVAPTESTLLATTYATQRGVDHRAISSANPVIFSEARGNLANPVLTIDRTQEVTFALAGGKGEGVLRQTAFASDPVRVLSSPLNHREVFVDMSNVDDATQLQHEADAAVWAGRPVQVLTAELVETPGTTRGIHFDLGDAVTIEHRGLTLDVRLDLIHESLSSQGRKSEIRVRTVL